MTYRLATYINKNGQFHCIELPDEFFVGLAAMLDKHLVEYGVGKLISYLIENDPPMHQGIHVEIAWTGSLVFFGLMFSDGYRLEGDIIKGYMRYQTILDLLKK